MPDHDLPPQRHEDERENGLAVEDLAAQPATKVNNLLPLRQPPTASTATSLVILGGIAVIFLGLVLNNFWLVLVGTVVTLSISFWLLIPVFRQLVNHLLRQQWQSPLLASLGLLAALIGLLKLNRFERVLYSWYLQLDWNAIGALGEVIGAVGQIFIAILAVYVAWRQYVISKDLTIQQNLITQQQTIDTYFQGISDLVLDEQGLLEDWPQERAIAEGRTAAILSSVDAAGKAKIIRFLSHSKLLTPIKRDQRLGRAILNGAGGYAEDRMRGVRVIDLGVMLATADLSGTDLRWTDLSEADLSHTNLSRCDLTNANLTRTILSSALLIGANLRGARLFYGLAKNATPRSYKELPNYRTGAHTGAVVENADFTGVQRLSEPARYYCCAWGGSRTRATIPGGCEGIPNRLGR